jgi:type I restriction enzyme S subunit
MGVTPKTGLLPEFLFNFFLQLDLREINNGSSIPQINNYSIEPLPIRYPTSITDQKAIVTTLDSLSIETKKLETIYRKKLSDLDELKRSVLQKAFNGELTAA